MEKHMRRHPYMAATIALIFGIAGGFGMASALAPKLDTDADIVREGGYQFINPLLSCGVSEDAPYSGFSNLQQALESQSDKFIAQGQAKRVSVYFRDMDQGFWTGVRSNDLFAPASLMKVPLLMAYLKKSQTSPTLLQSSFTLSVPEDQNAKEYFKPSSPLSLGQSYTVQELLNAMIEQSDNNAAYVLGEKVNDATLQTVYEDSGIPPVIDESADSLSPHDYMQVFRLIYNATFLGKTRSQTAFELLGKTEFPGGIVAGVPAGTPVVHKFGERTVLTPNQATDSLDVKERELHDCGIVYYKGHPYGICIMTQGSDFTQLQKVIAALSQTAYTSVADGLLDR